MVLIISLALFAASTTAQLTTSIWAPGEILGTDKLGFYGSVVGADESHTTIFLTFDNGTDTQGLGLDSTAGTWTVGPGLYDYASSVDISDESTRSGDSDLRVRCERQSTSNAKPTCTESYGRALAELFMCQTPQASPTPATTVTYTVTNSFSGRGSFSAGVETLIRNFTLQPVTKPVPSWCNDESYMNTFDGRAQTVDYTSSVLTYQVIITAGLEKLNATTGASATPSTARPTNDQTTSTGLATFTGGAAPMKTGGPAVVGFGAAMVAFFL